MLDWRNPSRWKTLLLVVAWAVVFASLPWWFGLPILLGIAATLVFLEAGAGGQAAWLRRALRWGLPGMLFALQRALGGDALAWGAALLGALAGYTLLAGLDAWRDRHLQREPIASSGADDWPTLAQRPLGPPAEIIELQLPVWQHEEDRLTDPLGGDLLYRDGGYAAPDGTWVADVATSAGFSPQGRWFVAQMHRDRGVVLWDRERNKRHRLRGWQLRGWFHEQPWLSRREGEVPLSLHAVLGQDDPADPE
ncbi:MAG: hypothetical protein ABI114_05285 [Rhodanobacter sp.]